MWYLWSLSNCLHSHEHWYFINRASTFPQEMCSFVRNYQILHLSCSKSHLLQRPVAWRLVWGNISYLSSAAIGVAKGRAFKISDAFSVTSSHFMLSRVRWCFIQNRRMIHWILSSPTGGRTVVDGWRKEVIYLSCGKEKPCSGLPRTFV